MTVTLRENRQSLSICLMSSWTEGFQWNSTKKNICHRNRKNGEVEGIHDMIAPFQFQDQAATRSRWNDHAGEENARVEMWSIA
jgi:hypothetical protein